ncbi:MAG TPA: YdiU family protein, partial [Burkholderiales bacterium]|nr:YdiU family protein [Burkholderiales bacterium]
MTARPKIEPGPVSLEHATFEDTFVRDLPADPVLDNVPRPVRDASYTRVEPTPVAAPRLLAWSDELGDYLGIARPSDATGLTAEILGGSKTLVAMRPYAARYGGHQFGHWAGQLGDGRAITLGEIIAVDGSRQELQLKGAGKTPYSRTADGRAVLRSSLREFLCSEAMRWLGVPTTRALSLVATGEMVIRDMFYDGNPEPEPGSVVCRVAPSFVRFGNFQIHAACDELDALKRLADYVIREHYPGSTYQEFFHEVCRRTALLMVDWMRLGFVHGVMNTDNMSILGLTIDYGPYGWLEGYDPSWTPNTTDAGRRRYCYGNQPHIGLWNLTRLAAALIPLIEDRDALQQGLTAYGETYDQAWGDSMARKLGLVSLDPPDDEALVNDLFEALQRVETDMTLFFRLLASVPTDPSAEEAALVEPLRRAFYTDDAFSPEPRSRM